MDYATIEQKAKKEYKHFYVSIAGKTVLGRNIYRWSCIFDDARPFVLLNAGVHAREYVGCDVMIKLIELIESDYENLKLIGTPNIIILPMVNADGIELVKRGVQSVPKDMREKLLKINNGNYDFSLYKANANGVDINNNFDAKWERQKGSKVPCSNGYKGKKPFSEPETQVLVQETKMFNPALTLSFHTKGEEVYYNFYQRGARYWRDRKIAKLVASTLGYKIKNVQRVSSGGYKDWCVSALKIPALTVELASDDFVHPIKEEYAEKLFYKVKDLCYTLADLIGIVKEYEPKIHD